MSDKLFSTITTILNGDNYHDWKFAVGMILKHRGCFDVVTGIETQPSSSDATGLAAWKKKADDGLTVIGLTVDSSQYTFIRASTNGVEAWQALKDQYEKNTRATRISLKRQFFGFQHDPHVPMQTYIAGITDLAAKLTGIGITLSADDITDVLIFNLAPAYSSLASTLMATKGDLKVSEVTSALLEEERRLGGGTSDRDAAYALYGKGSAGPGRSAPTCFRCGRKGHRLKECSAQKHFNGGPITAEMEEEARRKASSFQSKASASQAVDLNHAISVSY
ncbi:hypothetical protein D9611_010695 [Ephemerocybe angulata]|uniref:CCHC-type domain-containing protein n=1 Tax=Ephemerocybe angulata TaxID=980116 RepID=A0A8H5BC12_9AGAR|nr:hypothetical protein D9611_010695 [Tulosesus angulatus]